MISPGGRSALLQLSLMIDSDTDYGISVVHGQVWIGAAHAGAGDVCLSGDADGFENLAAALMLAATEMREAQLVAALAPSGQPSTPEVAA